MAQPPQVIQWALDTRPLWPSATTTKQLSTAASSALALLPVQDHASVLRFYHLRDAKVALASALLKRFAIAYFCAVPWAAATAVRDARSKPVFLVGDEQPLIFNVSHQNGVVALFAVRNPPPGLQVGVDVVCATERRVRDHESVRREGWPAFVDMHADVLCVAEVRALKSLRVAAEDEASLDRAFRHFYALWCLREAYVKMTGEALLAPWLGELEMRGFAPPEEMGSALQEIWFQGRRLEDVEVRLVDLLDQEEGYMVSTAVKRGNQGESILVSEFKWIDIESVIAYGEGRDLNPKIEI